MKKKKRTGERDLKRLRFNLDAAAASSDHSEVYNQATDLARELYYSGDFSGALARLQQAIRAVETLKKRLPAGAPELRGLNMKLLYPFYTASLCLVKAHGQDWFRRALADAKKHLSLAGELGVLSEVVAARRNIGYIYFNAHEDLSDPEMQHEKLALARWQYELALKELKAVPMDARKKAEQEISLFINLGLVEKAEDKKDKAAVTFRKALEGSERLRFENGRMIAAFNLGSIHFEERRFADAVGFLETDLAINQSTKNYTSEAKTLVLLSEAFLELGKVEKAVFFLGRLDALLDSKLRSGEFAEYRDKAEEIRRKVAEDGGVLEYIDRLETGLRRPKESAKSLSGKRKKEELEKYLRAMMDRLAQDDLN